MNTNFYDLDDYYGDEMVDVDMKDGRIIYIYHQESGKDKTVSHVDEFYDWAIDDEDKHEEDYKAIRRDEVPDFKRLAWMPFTILVYADRKANQKNNDAETKKVKMFLDEYYPHFKDNDHPEIERCLIENLELAEELLKVTIEGFEWVHQIDDSRYWIVKNKQDEFAIARSDGILCTDFIYNKWTTSPSRRVALHNDRGAACYYITDKLITTSFIRNIRS